MSRFSGKLPFAIFVLQLSSTFSISES